MSSRYWSSQLRSKNPWSVRRHWRAGMWDPMYVDRAIHHITGYGYCLHLCQGYENSAFLSGLEWGPFSLGPCLAFFFASYPVTNVGPGHLENKMAGATDCCVLQDENVGKLGNDIRLSRCKRWVWYLPYRRCVFRCIITHGSCIKLGIRESEQWLVSSSGWLYHKMSQYDPSKQALERWVNKQVLLHSLL